ncbi:MAG TPA: flagellar basal body rod C-terminal domain-containing protein, partial [Dissulfurispiraceae bacterium]
ANGVPVTVSGAVGVLNEIGFTANPTVPAGGSAPGDKAVAANANNIILDWADTSSTAKSIFGFNSSPSISSVSSAASDYAVYPVLPGDNRNAKLIAGIMNQQVISGATPGDYYQQIVSGVGVDTQTSKQSQQFETNLVNQLQNKRDEVSGVSLDEEAANLVKYQKSYEAAAKMVSIAEELLTTLINMTGR